MPPAVSRSVPLVSAVIATMHPTSAAVSAAQKFTRRSGGRKLGRYFPYLALQTRPAAPWRLHSALYALAPPGLPSPLTNTCHLSTSTGHDSPAVLVTKHLQREGVSLSAQGWARMLRVLVAMVQSGPFPAVHMDRCMAALGSALAQAPPVDAQECVQILLPVLQLSMMRAFRSRELAVVVDLTVQTLCQPSVAVTLHPFDAAQTLAAAHIGGATDTRLMEVLLPPLSGALATSVRPAMPPGNLGVTGVYVDGPAVATSDPEFAYFHAGRDHGAEREVSHLDAAGASNLGRLGTTFTPFSPQEVHAQALAGAAAVLQTAVAAPPGAERDLALPAATAIVALAQDVVSRAPPGVAGSVPNPLASLAAEAEAGHALHHALTALKQRGGGHLDPNVAKALGATASRLAGHLHAYTLKAWRAFSSPSHPDHHKQSAEAAYAFVTLLHSMAHTPRMLRTPRTVRPGSVSTAGVRGAVSSKPARLLFAAKPWLLHSLPSWAPSRTVKLLQAVGATPDADTHVASTVAVEALCGLATHAVQRVAENPPAHGHSTRPLVLRGCSQASGLLRGVCAVGMPAAALPLLTVSVQPPRGHPAPPLRVSVDLLGEALAAIGHTCSASSGMQPSLPALCMAMSAAAFILRSRAPDFHDRSMKVKGASVHMLPPEHLLEAAEAAAGDIPLHHLSHAFVQGVAGDISRHCAEQLANGSLVASGAVGVMDGLLAAHFAAEGGPAPLSPPVTDFALATLAHVTRTSQVGRRPLTPLLANAARAVGSWAERGGAAALADDHPVTAACRTFLQAITDSPAKHTGAHAERAKAHAAAGLAALPPC